MSVQLTSTARVVITNGELVAAPVFKNTAAGARFARIRLQTVAAFVVNGERRIRKSVHEVVVYNPHGVRLLEQFKQPGIAFIVNGNLVYDDSGKAVVEVTAFGNDIFVSYVAGEADTGRSDAKPKTSADTPSAARSSGGIGRLSERSDDDPSERQGGYRAAAPEYDTDDIPF